MVMAAVFFVSTAISRGWIGPTAQLSGATVVSLALIAQSFRFSDAVRPVWKRTLAGVGASALLASGVVGFMGLELLSFEAALAWFAVAVVAMFALGRWHGSEVVALLGVPSTAFGAVLLDLSPQWIAVVSLALMASTIITAVGQRWYVFNMSGVLTGALGVVGVVVFEDVLNGVALWAIPVTAIVVSLAAVVVQAIAFHEIDESSRDTQTLLALLEARVAAMFIPFAAVMVGVIWVEYTDRVDPEFAMAGVGLVGLAAALGTRTLSNTMQMLHSIAAIATMTLALVSELDGPILLVAILGQTVLAAVLAYRSPRVELLVPAGLLAGVTSMWTLSLIAHGMVESGFDLADGIATGLVLLAALGGTWLLRDHPTWGDSWIPVLMTGLGWVAAVFHDVPQGQMFISLTWAALGTTLIVAGARSGRKDVVYGGLGTLALTAAKLLSVDLQEVDILWRAGLFFVVGAGFLRLAFVLPSLLGEANTDDSDVELVSAAAEEN